MKATGGTHAYSVVSKLSLEGNLNAQQLNQKVFKTLHSSTYTHKDSLKKNYLISKLLFDDEPRRTGNIKRSLDEAFIVSKIQAQQQSRFTFTNWPHKTINHNL